MRLFAIQYREPAYGQDRFVLMRNVYEDEQRAWNVAENILSNHFHIESYEENDRYKIGYYHDSIVLFSDYGKTEDATVMIVELNLV